MNIQVGQHIVKILNSNPINEKEIDISKCYFEFDEEITDNYVKEAYFTLNNHTYKQIITNNQCDIPYEVLTQKGELEIGVVAYLVENDEEIKRYNPSPDYFTTWRGSLKNADNSEPITPSDKEQIEQMLANINIDANKVGKITTITYVNKDGIEHQITLEDGKSIEYNWQETSLGIRQEGQSQYEYVNLKGDKGDAGAIKMIIVQELPTTGEESTIYLVPLETPESEENRFKEYVWINNQWELLGKIGIQVDLTDYVKNTDYATSSKGGVIKSGYYGLQVDSSNGKAYCDTYTYANYGNVENQRFISKGTLENVITGKDLTTKSYVDSLVGDIETILTTLDIGSGV